MMVFSFVIIVKPPTDENIVNDMNDLSSSFPEAVAVSLRPSKACSASMTLKSTTRPKLTVLTPEKGKRETVRKISRNISFPNRLKGEFNSPKHAFTKADSSSILPDRAPDDCPAKIRRVRSNVYRAAERGVEDVLPIASATNSVPIRSPLRSRARSSGPYASRSNSAGFSGGQGTSDQIQSSMKSLRSRRRSSSRQDRIAVTEASSCVSDDLSVEFSLYDHEEELNSKAPVYADDSVIGDGESIGANKKLARQPVQEFFPKIQYDDTWLNMKPPQFLTVMMLLAITCFVAGSYRQVLAATVQIEEVRLGESTLLVHLHKVEQQALQLTDVLKHINDRNDGSVVVTEEDRNSAQIDSDLLRVQAEKLRDMEAELDHEVRTLRKKIQQSARQSMVKYYGQGGIQAFLEVELSHENEGDEDAQRHEQQGQSANELRNTLSLRLWYDTPHTGWTFIQQIRAGLWDGASFSIQQGRALVAEPRGGGQLRPGLDFLEPSERGHERYTVTLTDTSLAINLQDNKKIHSQEACVGVIFEGFDVLHNVVKGSNSRTVRIKKARASHMTRAETAGLI